MSSNNNKFEVFGEQLEVVLNGGLATATSNTPMTTLHSSVRTDSFGTDVTTKSSNHIASSFFVKTPYGDEIPLRVNNFQAREGSRVAIAYINRLGANTGCIAAVKNLDTGQEVIFDQANVVRGLKITKNSLYAAPLLVCIALSFLFFNSKFFIIAFIASVILGHLIGHSVAASNWEDAEQKMKNVLSLNVAENQEALIRYIDGEGEKKLRQEAVM